MTYNLRFTAEDYRDQWVAANSAGRKELAERLLTAAKKNFGDALGTKILEALHLDSEDNLNPSKENLRLWHEIKRASAEESHKCVPPLPCRVCCEHAFALMAIAFQIEAYSDTLEHADILLELDADDIIALLYRTLARIYLGDENEMTDPHTTVLSTVISDIKRVGELTMRLPDDRIFYLKSDRDHPELVEEKNRKHRLLQFIQGFMTKGKADADPTDGTAILRFGESMPLDTFDDTLHFIIGTMLMALGHSEEGVLVCKENFEAFREADDREMIVIFGWLLGYILVVDAPEPDAAAALPYLTESLAAATDDEERQYKILEFVALCLLSLEEPTDPEHLNEIKQALVLLEMGVERAIQADEASFILYAIGFMNLRLERLDKSLAYFILGLKFSGDGERFQYPLLECFIECLSNLKRQTDLEDLDHIKNILALLTGVDFLKELIASSEFMKFDEYLQMNTLELLKECLTDLEPAKIVSLIERLIEWAGEDEQRVGIVKQIISVV